MPKKNSKRPIEIKDCSRFKDLPGEDLTEEDLTWLKELASEADTSNSTLSNSYREYDPIISFDSKGDLWSGRYIGEVKYKKRILRIKPRFGEEILTRWLGEIWGVHLLPSEGSYEDSETTWVWRLLAHLWQARLIDSAKHGLPFVRKMESYTGLTARGRLDIRATIKMISSAQLKLVSQTRKKYIDEQITSIILHAFDILTSNIKNKEWLNPRAKEIKTLLRLQTVKLLPISVLRKSKIRYTPITQLYRPIVELSWMIIKGQSLLSVSEDNGEVKGVLLDVAEIWELYLFNLLKKKLSGFQIEYTGRTDEINQYLLMSDGRKPFMGLKPDFLIKNAEGRLVAILDAKYKNTHQSKNKSKGVRREDVYQMNAYLSAFSDTALSGALIYPSCLDASLKHTPWQVGKGNNQLWFLDLGFSENCVNIDEIENQFVQSMIELLGQ